MRSYKAKDVDAYIAHADIKARPKLKELRNLILAACPAAEETISWGMPFYKYHGLLGGFAAFKNHVSFFGVDAELNSTISQQLEKKGYTVGKKTIQIAFDQKMPAAALKTFLKAKIKKNKDKQAAKTRPAKVAAKLKNNKKP